MQSNMADISSNATYIEETAQTVIPYLIFEVDGQQFGLDIQYVTQIIPMLKLTPMPQVDYLIEGVANIHGAMVPVIDVRRYLGVGEVIKGINTPIILTQVMDRPIGLIVDDVAGVASLDAAAIIRPDTLQLVDVDLPPIVNGLVYQQGQSILLLDPRYFLRASQFQAIHRSIYASVHPFLIANAKKPHPGAYHPAPGAKVVSFEILQAVITKKLDQIHASQTHSNPNQPRSIDDVED